MKIFVAIFFASWKKLEPSNNVSVSQTHFTLSVLISFTDNEEFSLRETESVRDDIKHVFYYMYR